jgi:uncharacterized protein YbcV (DUF1398 family)
MDADRISLAQSCLNASHDGSMSFPAIIGTLSEAGFEGYEVNYRTGAQTFYLPDGESVVLPAHAYAGSVKAVFDPSGVETLVRWAQSGDAAYSYSAFSEQVKQAGCAGYLVSFLGRRVVYYGRTAETYVELFPQ